MRSIARALTCSALLMSSFVYQSGASAQFVGDVFFTEPSVVIAPGQTGEIDFAIFTGDKAFGAVNAAIRFDPGKLAVTQVTAVTEAGVTPAISWEETDGVLRIVAVNGESLSAPIGTVRIARVTLRATGQAGSIVTVASEVSRALSTDRLEIRKGDGFGAEVGIGQPSAGSQATVGGAGSIARNEAVRQRAVRLRPAGHEVNVLQRTGAQNFERARIQIPGNDAGID